MKNFLYIFLCLIFLNGCTEQVSENEIPEELLRPIIFTSETFTISSDETAIQNIEIINDALIIEASYKGGCDPHSFALFSVSGFMETFPAQMSMKFVHHAFDDTCGESLTNKFYFDLKSVASLYKLTYRTNKGSVSLFIYDSDSTSYYQPQPRYDF